MKKLNVKPFIKWVGGKTQLMRIIQTLIPEKFNTYYEPFLGGGSVFLNLQPEKSVISDINSELIDAWNTVKSNKNLLMKNLDDCLVKHSKDFYLKMRKSVDIDVASRFIYLNKTCFNGIYRVNSKGLFNVPYNQKDNIIKSTLYSKSNLDNISKLLENTEIKNLSYLEVLKSAKSGDFVFIDPPYDYDGSGFDSYNKDKWTKDDTIGLLNYLIELDKLSVKWMLTNHNTKLVQDLMKNYQSFVIPVNRFVNSNGDSRSNAAHEVIIINYELNEIQKSNFKLELFFKSLKSSSYFLKKYVSWDEISKKLSENDELIFDLNKLLSVSVSDFWKNLDDLFKSNPESLKLLPLLISRRVDDKIPFVYLDEKQNEQIYNYQNLESVKNFLKLSGLIDNLFVGGVTDLRQYIYGVEVGLSNNDKKNKSGDFMSQSVEELLNKYKIKHTKEVKYSTLIESKESDKQFDYVLEINNTKYCVEVNFFNGGGSKSYSETDRFIKVHGDFDKYHNLKFIWITDGSGVNRLRNKIEPEFNKNYIFNLDSFKKFLLEKCNI